MTQFGSTKVEKFGFYLAGDGKPLKGVDQESVVGALSLEQPFAISAKGRCTGSRKAGKLARLPLLPS